MKSFSVFEKFYLKAVSVFVSFIFLQAGQPMCLAAQNANTPLKIGFVLVGPANDWGWNYAHNQGRLYLEESLPGQVETIMVESVADNAEVERVMERMISQGTKLIFTTSYGFLEPALRVAERHPSVIIEHCGRASFKLAKNVGTCLSYHFEPMCVAGYVAGCMTKTNKLGFVAAHPVPQVLQTINGFTQGARLANSQAQVHVVWTNQWSDLPVEVEAAKGLIDMGADVLAMQQNSPAAIVQTAEKQGVYVIGFHADLKKFAPKYWLTGQKWIWGPLYVKIAQAVQNHTWKASNDRFGMKYGYVQLSPFGKAVPASVRKKALALQQRIETGAYKVFQGPLKDCNGNEKVAKGKTITSHQLDTMNWFVEGVKGSLPHK